MKRASGIVTALLAAACAGSAAKPEPDDRNLTAAPPQAAPQGRCAARGPRIVRAESPDRDMEERDHGYRVVEGADTTLTRPLFPATDLDGDGDPDLVLGIVGTEVPDGQMVGVYLLCGGDRYATALEPEYAYEVRLGEPHPGSNGRRSRDLVWVERSGSRDPGRERLASYILRLSGERFSKFAGSGRALPPDPLDCTDGLARATSALRPYGAGVRPLPSACRPA